eukprot:10484527-Heterocapsa_arctica.AAC.1
MGKVCAHMKSVADYHKAKDKACNNTLGCLMCKAFFDMYESQKHPDTNDKTSGMTQWIRKMRGRTRIGRTPTSRRSCS